MLSVDMLNFVVLSLAPPISATKKPAKTGLIFSKLVLFNLGPMLKLFTAVIYCPSTETLLLCVKKQ
jgi:hypothetical protein